MRDVARTETIWGSVAAEPWSGRSPTLQSHGRSGTRPSKSGRIFMKLAVSTYSLARWRSENNKSLEDSLRWIADSGAGAVEFTGFGDENREPVARARELRKTCEKLKLSIVGYCV